MTYSRLQNNSKRQEQTFRQKPSSYKKEGRKPDVQAEINEEKEQERKDTVHNIPKKNNSNFFGGLLSGLFTDGKIDNDKILIIALIIILAKEGADLKLLIALGYILM